MRSRIAQSGFYAVVGAAYPKRALVEHPQLITALFVIILQRFSQARIELEIDLCRCISRSRKSRDPRERFSMGFGHELERRGSERDDDVGSAIPILANVKIPEAPLVSGIGKQHWI
jgi:hypothetical protein